MADDSSKPADGFEDAAVPAPKPAHDDDSKAPGAGTEPERTPEAATPPVKSTAPVTGNQEARDPGPSGNQPESAATPAHGSEPEQSQDPKAAKRRAKREKARLRAERGTAAGSTQVPDTGREPADGATALEPAPESATASETKAAKRRAKRGKAQAAAERGSQHGPRRKFAAITGSSLIVLASAAAVTAGSLYAPQPQNTPLPSAVTSLPAGDSVYTCATVPQLLKGVEGTDPQFAPGAEDVSTTIRTAVVSDLAKRIPGSGLGEIGQEESRRLTERVEEAEASQGRGSDAEGLTGRTAAVQDTANLDPLQVLRIQPLGGLPSMGSGLRSYQAQDGDLAGLAASTCLAAESNWRFTGLQTTTGASSVLHLANPTSTTAQVSIELRGADGLIDTSTLQEIVVAPGTTRAIVLGGYAQGQESVSANVRSLGGKITATVQQSALRGLTPSGVDFVAANAPAATMQVIPGVWIDEKSNIDELTAGEGAESLVPQLHISATGSQGAGIEVKVLDSNGEVALDLAEHQAVSSDATSVVDLRQLASGYYTVVVEADNPVTAAVRMVRGQNPEDSSDTAWAASSRVLNGNQVVPLSAHGNATFTLAAPQDAASVDAIVISRDGSMAQSQTIEVPAGTSRTFKPSDVSEDAAAVLFQGDSNAYIGQTLLGSNRSVSWVPMPPATGSREGIVVNVAG
ncbi:DUF5719 family protein [Glutamicibacter sp. MNS18]|uniref:DUF5719 family protein n=1 Tax=Glutamicibacter sp. MNS18 TaxID=2989817 RepID=UPI0022367062|nr:DUF5719 family protein [Glutamicibacter sp. MNS18]MCW4465102.1 DUF5719 family protein [Glutamicibacter sp. MNS18]